MRRRRLRAVLLALGFVVGLAVGLVTCAHGAVIDLTASGVDAWVDLKKSDGSGSTITRKISVSNQTAWVDDGTDGEVEFIFLAADIAALTADYNFDVWFVKSASSVKRKVYEGRVRFDAERA